MKDKVIVFIADSSNAPLPWVRVNQHDSIIGQGTIAAIEDIDEKWLNDASLQLVLPSNWTSQHQLQLPNLKRETLAAIPYQLEDKLSAPVEDLLLTKELVNKAERRFKIIAVAKHLINDLINHFEQLNLPLIAITALTFKPHEEDFAVLNWQENVIISDGKNTLTLDQNSFEQWLVRKPLGKTLTLFKLENSLSLASILSDKEHHEQIKVSTISSIADAIDVNSLNLYRKRANAATKKSSLLWKLPVWTAAASVLIFTLFLGYQNHQLQQQIDDVQANNRALFQQSFPTVRRIIDIRKQAEQQLAIQAERSKGSPMLIRLNELLNIIGNEPKLRFNTISYSAEESAFALTFQSVDKPTMQRVIQRLTRQKSLAVKVEKNRFSTVNETHFLIRFKAA